MIREVSKCNKSDRMIDEDFKIMTDFMSKQYSRLNDIRLNMIKTNALGVKVIRTRVGNANNFSFKANFR